MIFLSFFIRPLSKLVKVGQNYNKLNLRPNLLLLFRYLSAIISNYLNQFRKMSIITHVISIKDTFAYQAIVE
ncbi:hypothetical protein ACA350_00110 [Orientia tsutsugamushi]|uniref:hypothetical protein n=1 Tax=Orientia tsutsugamushi TaxID=784 RepID=UPI0035287998